ncbi:MAG TPA: NAD(P)-dependent oxidoreductase [Edaphocola sp.]|nr:NAD(P)-dependent oxidoreductase [Edaphocola sp.]
MKKKVTIIGGGTAALFIAAFLNPDIFDITIFEKKAALGRKFLVAGDGGFNLTHSELLTQFISRYTPAFFLDNALNHFSNIDLRNWLSDLGIPTYVGSSGRVFPEKGIKPIEVLKRIEALLVEKNVKFEFNKTFTGWDKDNAVVFNNNEIINSDYYVFALGGSSWKVTGSDGSWSDLFNKKGINTLPFKPSNCAYEIKWTPEFIKKQEGKPLKNIAISLNNKIQKGEAVITTFGIEGNAIYGLSPEIQSALATQNEVEVFIDFKPLNDLENLIAKLSESTTNITTTLKEKIKLAPAALDLLKINLSKEAFMDIPTLAKIIKSFPLKIIGSAPIDEAISTSGGIDLNAVDSNFELKELKNHFCIGEMLDWDAPTGGYLIQACASMGVYLAYLLNNILFSGNEKL